MQASLPANGLPDSEERTWAALAHASILLLGFGSIVALLIWTAQRRQSAYVAYHALQALLYQTLETVIFMLFGLVFGILSFSLTVLITILSPSNLGNNSFGLIFAAEFIPLFIFLVLAGMYLIGAVSMAVLCLTGSSPRYPWIGAWLAKYLDCVAEQVDERQECVAVAACHLGAYINLWGMALPLIAWLNGKNRSEVLRFQGLQALVYQAIGFISAVIFGIGMFALQIFLILTVAIGLPAASRPNNGLIFLLILIPVLISLLLTAIWLLALPFYQTFPLVAAWQVSHGKDYRYPILGKLIANLTLAKVPLDNLAKVPKPSQG